MTTKEELNIYIIVEKDIEQLVQKYHSGKINFAIYSKQKEALDKKHREDISKTNTIHYTNVLKDDVSNIKVKNI